ncbi:MAG: DUF87 domain-containing protein [Firmicutes bacterium]|nr:DUF87 domain-containing protein [Bacillota bacterium]
MNNEEHEVVSMDLSGGGNNKIVHRSAKISPSPAVQEGINKAVESSQKLDMPSHKTLQAELNQANKLVDDIVLKNYLTKLTGLKIKPLNEELKNINSIRLFKITEMIYQKDEYSTYKFASVFNSVQNLDCSVFIVVDSNKDGKTEFYMGVRALGSKHTTESLIETLHNALRGQFPGVKTKGLDLEKLNPENKFFNKDIQAIIDKIPSNNIAAVSSVPNNKDENFNNNENFIQGLEKLALAMKGERYTAVVLAKSLPPGQLTEIRQNYEDVYTGLSPFAEKQISRGTNNGFNFSDAFSQGSSRAKTDGKTESVGTNYGKTTTESDTIGSTSTTTINAATPGILRAIFGSGPTTTTSSNASNSKTTGFSDTTGGSDSTAWQKSVTDTESDNLTNTIGFTGGSTENLQMTVKSKKLINTLDRIDSQLKRIDECESLGMWECAAYFLSDSQKIAERAAGTYKALMSGEKSGVETSAINLWSKNASQDINESKKLGELREYITNFIHPVFEYNETKMSIPVTAGALVSGNELALQMGLPRKSVRGFPVIEHADFAKEVVKYGEKSDKRQFPLGKIFSMGEIGKSEVNVDTDSLTKHTFITGSTGSGKSNTVYQMLHKLRNQNVPFLVIEPAKGEYMNIFGKLPDVSVYGTNHKLTKLLRINPFYFPFDKGPKSIHILEHLERLVEIFNACWPMYSSMPAMLKEGIENAYKATGWDLITSENVNLEKLPDDIFPNFAEVAVQIDKVINESEYSAEVKGNYGGALLSRINSLTTGLNQLIFTADDLSDEQLFDKNTIIDLSRVGSSETKSLIMGILLMKLGEYRMTSGKRNSELSHITVLEEAHNILKRTSTEQSAEGSNLIGKSVEMLANSIAEMRTYGEGFIIADQSPGLLDMSAIRNTNTKIVLRLPEKSDRELVGYAANLKDEQISELAKLETGVAAVYQNDWVEPVLVKMDFDPNLDEKDYICPEQVFDERKIQRQIIHMMIQKRVGETLHFDTSEIRKSLRKMSLTVRQKTIIRGCLDEHDESVKNGKPHISIWEADNFPKLAQYLTESAELRKATHEIAINANKNISEIAEKLTEQINRKLPGFSEKTIAELANCLMLDFSLQKKNEKERKETYEKWKTERGMQ